jgi:hypothetical protein
MATVIDAIHIARTLLNDDAGLVWSHAVLMPKIVLAHNEMRSKLILNGIAVTYESTALITIPAGQLNMGMDQPADLINPIKLNEISPGDDISNAIPMERCDFIPDLDQEVTLRYWAWIQQQIVFLGATADRQVQLYYLRDLVAPKNVTDPLVLLQSETYLGARTAALCRPGTPQYVQFSQIAENSLSSIVRTEVKRSQNLPVRRRPFSWSIKNRRRFTI